MQDHVAHDVQRALQVLGQEASVEHGVLLARSGVLLSADALERLGDLKGVHRRCAFEEHVLHQVADTGYLLLLIAAAGTDPNSKSHARSLFQRLGEDPQTSREVASALRWNRSTV